jgi:NADH dehydrogenase/putative oxidoreductase
MNSRTLPFDAHRRQPVIVDSVSAFAATVRFLERTAGPVVDLSIRLWLAQVFFVSAVLKLAHWDTALYLAANEYPVSWLSPVAAAYLGAAIEFVGAVAIAFGFATRLAAACLLALACVIQFNYRELDVHLFWIALFGWYVVRGAGPLSLDRMLARGLADSALPFAAPVLGAYAAFTKGFGPVYVLLLRFWAGGAIVLAGMFAGSVAPSFAGGLPLRSAGEFATVAQALLALLLVLGLGTRVAALGLMLLSGAAHLMGGGYADHGYWLMLFALFATYGAGGLSLDASIDRALRRRFPELDGKPAFSLEGLPRVVVIGAGFGGLACAASLAKARVAVTLVDRHNYHLFQPLLYQVATASLSPGDIATPIRGLFREHFNVRVLLGEVTGVDSVRQEVLLQDRRLPYDYLVLATGAAHAYFGRDEWAPYAPGLKRVEDATEIRRRLLSAFERAEATDDAQERASLLTFLIVGGGPTGVELAGAIAELARFGMEKEFRHFDPASARILLVQAAPRLLPTFPEPLSEVTQTSLAKLGVEILLNSRVEMIDDGGVTVSGRRIPSRTVLWAAGVMASPAARWLGAEADGAGRAKVGPDLSVPGLPNVFVVGDTALANAWKGGPVPGLAPAAKQGGAYVAQLIRARVEGRKEPAPFVYRHVGSLATIGRKAAVVDFGFMTLRGTVAWWFWGAMHVGFLIGLRNRVSVMFDWLWAYLTFSGGTRLITGGPSATQESVARPELRRVAVS